eukprot:2024912-Pleurochrysis_carterae.AAC.4
MEGKHLASASRVAAAAGAAGLERRRRTRGGFQRARFKTKGERATTAEAKARKVKATRQKAAENAAPSQPEVLPLNLASESALSTRTRSNKADQGRRRRTIDLDMAFGAAAIGEAPAHSSHERHSRAGTGARICSRTREARI